jgi:hypothetical protein
LRPLDEPLFDTMGENVFQASDLSGGFSGNDDGLIATTPELLAPIHKPTGFAGEVRV